MKPATTDPVVFQSHRTRGGYAVLALCALYIAWVLWRMLHGNDHWLRVLFAVGIAVVPWCSVFQSYALSADALVVRRGPLTSRIKFEQIDEITPLAKRQAASIIAPFSRDALQILYRAGTTQQLVVAPRDSTAFVSSLAQRAGLTQTGDRARRVEPPDPPAAPTA